MPCWDIWNHERRAIKRVGWCDLASCILLSASLAMGARAETAQLTTGQYAPLIGEDEPEYGVTAAIVTAALKVSGIDTKLIFLPWRRGYFETEAGHYTGTFPYVKNQERVALFLFSEPFFADRIRLFARDGTNKDQDWNGKSVCVPKGYDITHMKSFRSQYAIRLENPSEMKNCFLMLKQGHVDAVWSSELVGVNAIKSIYHAKISTLDIDVANDVGYCLIVSRKLPDGEKWIKLFDYGLAQIKKDGTYKKILARFGLK